MIDPKYYGDKPFYVCKDEFASGKFRIKESVVAEKKLDPNGDLVLWMLPKREFLAWIILYI